MNKKNKRNQINNRSNNKRFLLLPYEMLISEAYASLSNKAVKCLVDIAAQFNGKNNGDLSCTLKLMKKLGWNSNSQITSAKKELMEKGFIVLTRQGGMNKCSLYAITWMPIDECNGKLDRPATRVALGWWKKGFNPELQETNEKLKPVDLIAVQFTPNSGAITRINNYAVSH